MRTATPPRLKTLFEDKVRPELRKEFGITNLMAVPRIEKVVLNMGMGEAIRNIKMLDDAVEELAAIAGQRPTITRAKKSIAAFKLREGMPIGCRVTLRGDADVGVPRPPDHRRAAARARLPRRADARASTAAATTRWASATT